MCDPFMMHKRHLIVTITISAVVVFAIVQVRRSFVSERPDPNAKLVRTLTVKPAFKEYDTEQLRDEAEALKRALHQRVREELRGLLHGQRPSDAQCDAIAAAYAKFIVLRRTATREEYLDQVTHKPSPGLTDEDTENADQIWRYNSAWARHADIPVDSIRVVPMFVRGSPVGDFEPQGTRVLRQLAGDKLLSTDTVGTHSVYQVLIDLTIPSIDASEEFDVTLGTMLIDDGAQGNWSPVANEFIGVPRGKVCYVPRP